MTHTLTEAQTCRTCGATMEHAGPADPFPGAFWRCPRGIGHPQTYVGPLHAAPASNPPPIVAGDALEGHLGNALQILKVCQGKPDSAQLRGVRQLLRRAEAAAVAWLEAAQYVDQTDQGDLEPLGVLDLEPAARPQVVLPIEQLIAAINQARPRLGQAYVEGIDVAFARALAPQLQCLLQCDIELDERGLRPRVTL